MIRKYLLCVGKSGSYQGALNYICKKLKNNSTYEIELFISTGNESTGGIFGAEDFTEAEKILESCKKDISSKISNKVVTTFSEGSLPEGLAKRVLGDAEQEISAIVLGFSSASAKNKTVTTIIDSLGAVTTPIIIIPECVTEEQIDRLI